MRGCLSILLALLPLLGGAAELPRFAGTLAAQAHREHALTLAPGDFVQGRLTGKAMRLVLLDRDGKRERILAKGRRDEEEFMFVAGTAGPYTLDVRAPQAGDYELAVLRHVPAAAQQPSLPVPDSPRLRALQAAIAQGDGTDAFWRGVDGPLVETAGVTPALRPDEVLVTFLWRGARRNVRLMGGPSSDHDALQRLGDSDVWYRSYRVPASTRLSYRIAPDVPELDGPPMERRRAILATLQRDPLNPKSFPDKPLDRYDGASVLELPGAPPQQWVAPRAGVPAGAVETVRLASKALGNERDIVLYRSAGWRPGAPGNALVVLFDAESYTTDVPTPVILDNLVAAGRLPPTAAILVANPSGATRSVELPPNPAFVRFLATELMPWARARGVYAEPSRTAITGSSYGGLAAANAALHHPELFGNVYSQSGSFWWAPDGEEPEWLTRQFVQAPRLPVRFLLEAGLYEGARGGAPGILDTNRHLRDVLRARGYDVRHREFASGHDYLHWRGSLGDGLAALLGRDSGEK
jgi:enterochelin esterase family protein